MVEVYDNTNYLVLTFWLNQFNPSNKPSPVVAQEGWTYHARSRILCNPSFSVTSAGDMAIIHPSCEISFVSRIHFYPNAYLQANPACLQIPITNILSFHDQKWCVAVPGVLHRYDHDPVNPPRKSNLEYQCNSVATSYGSCPVLLHPNIDQCISASLHIQGVCLTQTLNLTFLYVTDSTLKPTVGIVVTDWFNLSL